MISTKQRLVARLLTSPSMQSFSTSSSLRWA